MVPPENINSCRRQRLAPCFLPIPQASAWSRQGMVQVRSKLNTLSTAPTLHRQATPGELWPLGIRRTRFRHFLFTWMEISYIPSLWRRFVTAYLTAQSPKPTAPTSRVYSWDRVVHVVITHPQGALPLRHYLVLWIIRVYHQWLITRRAQRNFPMQCTPPSQEAETLFHNTSPTPPSTQTIADNLAT